MDSLLKTTNPFLYMTGNDYNVKGYVDNHRLMSENLTEEGAFKRLVYYPMKIHTPL